MYLILILLENFNTKNCKDMSYMFSKCKSLNELNISNFNINPNTEIANMFLDCPRLIKSSKIRQITGEKSCICM